MLTHPAVVPLLTPGLPSVLGLSRTSATNVSAVRNFTGLPYVLAAPSRCTRIVGAGASSAARQSSVGAVDRHLDGTTIDAEIDRHPASERRSDHLGRSRARRGARRMFTVERARAHWADPARNPRPRPILIRGAIPKAAGMELAQVFGSTVSSPTVSFARHSRIVSGETLSDGDCDGLVGLPLSVFSDVRDSFDAARHRAS